ncbi:general secretion pathway protein L [Candidatus Magnetomoraceae bacterium gMMP-15]
MPEKILGLDIQEDAVNAVLIKSGLKSNEIIAHAHIPIIKSKDDDGWLTAVNALKKQIDVSGCISVSSFPVEKVCFRNMQLPFKDKKKINQILPFELEPGLLYPVEDVIIDYHIVKEAEKTDIIAASVSNDNMQEYWDRIKSFELEPEFVAIEGVSTALYLMKCNFCPENGLFIDTGDKKSTLIIFVSKNIHLIRSFIISSSDKNFISLLCSNIKQSLMMFKELFQPDYELDEVFITGSTCNLEQIDQSLAELLDVKISHTNFAEYSQIDMTGRMKQMWEPHIMDNALSLALVQTNGKKGFNLRKGSFAIEKRWLEYKKEIIITAILIFMIFITGASSLFIDNYYLEKQVEGLGHEIVRIFRQTLPNTIKIVDPVNQMSAEIEQLKQSFMVPGEKEIKIRVIDILNTISSLISKSVDVKFTRLVVTADDIQLSGNTTAFNSVDEIKNSLEKSKHFKNVIIASSKADRSGKGIKFKLRIHSDGDVK